MTTSIASIRGFLENEQLTPRMASSSSVGNHLKVDYGEIMTHLKDCSDVHTWFNRTDAYRIMQHVLSSATTLL